MTGRFRLDGFGPPTGLAQAALSVADRDIAGAVDGTAASWVSLNLHYWPELGESGMAASGTTRSGR